MFATMVCLFVAHGSEWAKAQVLVDSGSEHPPLISQNMADQLGLAGPISGEATQADVAFLPLRDVGNVDMIFNNKVVSQKFLSAPLSHYDVTQQRVDLFTPDPEAQAIDLQYKKDERTAMMSESIATGTRHATMSAVDRQSEMVYIDHAKACEKSLLATTLERRLLGMDDYLLPHTGARSRRQERYRYIN